MARSIEIFPETLHFLANITKKDFLLKSKPKFERKLNL